MDDLIYVPGTGLLYRLDPRSKLLFVSILCVYLVLERTSEALLLALFGLQALGLLSASTRRRLVPLWKMLAPVVLMIVFFGCLRWRAEDALLRVGPIAVTSASLWRAVGLGARIAGMSVGISLGLWTTEPGDAVAGLTRLGLPFELGFPAIMALQYVVTFRRTFTQILEAQESRGLTLPRGNPLRVARAYVPVLVPLIITALRSVDNLALALQSRGFGAGRPRTYRHTLRLHARDWIFVVAASCVLAGLALV
jgi:energy-coupling factor transport system permease protein